MAQEERFGCRDLTYSMWHRVASIKRFVGLERAQTLSMIDIDNTPYVEFDNGDKEPLALIEVARDVGQAGKAASVLKSLARRSSLPAFALLYKVSERLKNPADGRYGDIEAFRVQWLWPKVSNWYTISPSRWAEFLAKLRTEQAAEIDKLWRGLAEPAKNGRLF